MAMFRFLRSDVAEPRTHGVWIVFRDCCPRRVARRTLDRFSLTWLILPAVLLDSRPLTEFERADEEKNLSLFIISNPAGHVKTFSLFILGEQTVYNVNNSQKSYRGVAFGHLSPEACSLIDRTNSESLYEVTHRAAHQTALWRRQATIDRRRVCESLTPPSALYHSDPLSEGVSSRRVAVNPFPACKSAAYGARPAEPQCKAQ